MTIAAIAPHHFSLGSLKPQLSYPGGSRADARADNFPVLKGMSLSLLTLKPKAFREPHWHPNANELGYCLEGRALMTIFSPGSGHDTFIIEAGEIFFVPMGYLHHIENIGNSSARMLICFDHENPEDLNLSASVGTMPNVALGATFHLNPEYFSKFNRTAKSVFIGQKENTQPLELSYQKNRFKMNLEAENPQVQSAGGWVKLSNGYLLPTLEQLAVYSLCLKKNGVREPHWHPNAAELNFVIQGNVRITLFSPNGSIDTFAMGPGDISFLPRGYIHDIENTGEGEARLAVFFNHNYPSDLGLSGCLGAYTNDVLAATFGVPSAYLDKLPKYQEDLFIVAGFG